MKNKLMLSLAVVLLLLNNGCKKDLGKLPDEINKPIAKVEVKKYNPYSVENMRKALSNLMMKDVQLLANNKQKFLHGIMAVSNSSDALAINKDLTRNESLALAKNNIVATHYYIRFMPANEKDYAKLKVDSNLVIYPFPLDAAVSKYSGSYRDPSVPAGVPTYQYASVPVDYVLPDVPYTKLSDLYLPDERSKATLITIKGGGGSSYSIAGGRLVTQSICDEEPEIPDYSRTALPPEDCEEEYGGGGSGGGTTAPPGEWRPSGRITTNDDTHGIIGVEGIKVRARRWFTTYTGITDSDGNYYVDGTYTRQANYWLDFERYDFSVNDHRGGPREIGDEKRKGPWNVELTGFDKFCGEIFRAAFHYYYGDIQGLRRPPQNSFWATQVKLAAFDWYENADNGDMWAGRNLLLGSIIHIYHPQNFSQQTYATTIHELAHAVHWDMSTQVAGPFYTTYAMTPIRICDAWTRGVQWVLTKMVYPYYAGGENFDNYTNVVVDMIDSESDALYNLGKSGSLDQVEGYNIVQIQDALQDSYTSELWKTKLFNSTNNATAQHVEALFSNWGF